jgi:hypothetical protein
VKSVAVAHGLYYLIEGLILIKIEGSDGRPVRFPLCTWRVEVVTGFSNNRQRLRQKGLMRKEGTKENEGISGLMVTFWVESATGPPTITLMEEACRAEMWRKCGRTAVRHWNVARLRYRRLGRKDPRPDFSPLGHR